jgi:hypothetical protein
MQACSSRRTAFLILLTASLAVLWFTVPCEAG